MGWAMSAPSAHGMFDQCTDSSDGASAPNAALRRTLAASYDAWAGARLPRTLFTSLVDALFGTAPERLSRAQFVALHQLVARKQERGEPALGAFVGKAAPDLADEWVSRLQVHYVCPAVGPQTRALLFRAGDAVDAAYVLCKGCCSARSSGTEGLVLVWAEGDPIGLDDVLLQRAHRPLSAVFEASHVDDTDSVRVLEARPLLLRIAAASMAFVEPSVLLHFFSGALTASRRLATTFRVPPALRSAASLPASVLRLTSRAYDAGSVILERGRPVECAFAVVEGQLDHSQDGTFKAGSIVLLEEFLRDARNKRARGSLVARVGTLVAPLSMERLVSLLHDDAFRQLLNQMLALQCPAAQLHRLVTLYRGEPVAAGGRLVCGVVRDGRAASEVLVSVDAQPQQREQQQEPQPAPRVLSSVAVFASGPHVDATTLGVNMCAAFSERGRACVLAGDTEWDSHGCSYAEGARRFPQALRSLMLRLRAQYDVCVLVVPWSAPLEWARECVAAADAFVVVADDGCSAEPSAPPAGDTPAARVSPTPLDVIPRALQGFRRHFVLLHEHDQRSYLGSRLWQTEGMDWEGSHHVRKHHQDDVLRLCRRLSGRSLALVMGGHAEGVAAFAYVGVLEAFRQRGIPVDILGGSFTGAAVGAMHALSMSPRRLGARLRKMHKVYRLHDPLLDGLLSFVDSSFCYHGRFDRAVQLTFSFADADTPTERQPYHVEDLDVNGFFVTATHSEYATAAVLTKGSLSDLIAPALRMPTLLPGTMCTGSFSDALPCRHARALGAWKVFGVRVDVPLSGDARGGWWWSWALGSGHAALSHLAVAASRSHRTDQGDWTIEVDLSDVEAHEMHKAGAIARRGYDAAMHVLDSLEPEALEGASVERGGATHGDFAYLDEPTGHPYGRYLKLGLALVLGVTGFYWLRNKAYQAEEARLAEYLAGQAAVRTTFVLDPTAEGASPVGSMAPPQ